MDYPDNFLRGVSNSDLVSSDGISAAAFQFDDKGNQEWLEQSINWEDDDGSIVKLFKQKKDDVSIKFKVGALRVPRECMNYINRLPNTKDVLLCERIILDDNPYHGNLLLKRTTQKRIKRNVEASIALHVSDFIPQDEI